MTARDIHAVFMQVDELIGCNLGLELVDTVADKDLDVLTSLIQDDVCLLQAPCDVIHVCWHCLAQASDAKWCSGLNFNRVNYLELVKS